MIPNETRVKVNMDNKDDGEVITLLNRIGGTVVKELGDKRDRIGYLVAYDEKHLDAIKKAVDDDYENGLGTMFFSTLGKMRKDEFPGDKRYYLLAFESEIKQD